MAVLVTGGAGYIGSHTAVVLHEAGRDVVVLDDLSNSSPAAVDALRALTRPDLPFVEADAADVDAVGRAIADHGVDEVVHFAAFKSVSGSIADPDGYHRNNVGSTVGVVEAMRHNGVSRMVFSSSCTVYGEPTDLPVTEDSPISASNPYGATKVACEELLAAEAEAGGLDVLLLRYFNPVGAHASGDLGEDPRGTPDNLVPYLMQVAVGRRESLSVFGDDYDTPDGSAIRDYIHVVDLAEGHLAALDALAADRGSRGCTAVNLGTGTGYSVLDVLAAAGRVIGRPVPHQVVGRRDGDIQRIWADPSLAADLLGWRAGRGLDEMLADHWRWQQRHPDGYAAT
ncbi:MAG: UDP-glucose 4-epimerase GalE [Acidimicrobiales bacterium]|jgi:UDP-glucose 4-epimerase|nr:UDP-glucose 4-epimerase GalE [Acidimicrobiia bacterium]HIL48204.1 UDP-glucose 4-epimerase GalE [Acidimicrobiia bacterium]